MSTASVKWFWTLFSQGYNPVYSSTTFAGDSTHVNSNSNSSFSDTNNEFATRYVEMGSSTPSDLFSNQSGIISVSGCVSGGALIPQGVSRGDRINGSFINLPGGSSDFYIELRLSNDLPNGLDDISANGQFYKDDSGNWRNVDDDTIVATAQQVSNLPSGVDFNGWLIEDEVIKGSDGNYYNVDGSQMFENLPSGVIPSHSSVPDIYIGDDGNYYDSSGNQILENLPSGVTPSSQIGNLIVGSDGGYYHIDGTPAMENLPSGVDIVGYDSDSGTYEGSDGKHYDDDGNEVSEPCSGIEMVQNNTVRLTIEGIDIFGNQVNLGTDIVVGQTGINTQAIGGFNSIRKIDRIIARNLNDVSCVGSGQLKINGIVVGARIGLDMETIDTDVVLGSYNVATCVFSSCEKYADIVLNDNLPLGLTPNTQSLDVGYYILNSDISFQWSGFSDVFPICCGNYKTDEKDSGSTEDVNSSGNLDEIVEKLDDLIEAVKGLSTLVEVVVSPAEDVNIYRKRWHYNDGSDLDNLSGFSE